MHLAASLNHGLSVETVERSLADTCQLLAKDLKKQRFTFLPSFSLTHAGIKNIIFITDGTKDLLKEQMKDIVSLHKAQKPLREITRIVDVTRRCVRRLVTTFCDYGRLLAQD